MGDAMTEPPSTKKINACRNNMVCLVDNVIMSHVGVCLLTTVTKGVAEGFNKELAYRDQL